MRYANVHLIAGLIATTLFPVSTIMARAQDALANELTADQILQKTRDTYASFTTYTDEGRITMTMDDTVSLAFTTRLARTNFYEVEWATNADTLTTPGAAGLQAVWSSGAGNYLADDGKIAPLATRELALTEAAADTGGAAIAVPGLFFNLTEDAAGDSDSDLALEPRRLMDDKLGNIDCYVVASGILGQTNTFWIGKQDFLIHQRTMATSDSGMLIRFNRLAGTTSELDSKALPHSPAFIVTETHTNIVLNRPYLRSDFVPAVTVFKGSADE